ncbi:MAG: hypothetical protein JST12_08285 [Armatimonadetes bacterium]|nr:hypothetical protein [Armatimonadota bacterium]MBS1701644.1 hypothetical protein [Armatimonadota bacterium]MBS1727291.1 hypothetical protein [Armatimonadota bacterium]
MLETPTRGRFLKEERFLVFEPDRLYMGLVYACIGGGALMMVYGVVTFNTWFLSVGLMVFLAGIWANLSLVRIRFDLKNRTYRRRQGPGFVPRLWQGTLDEIDALVVVASPSLMAPGAANYHLVLHWKQGRAPLMVLETETRLPAGSIQMGGQPTVARAAKFASAMRIPIYDNTQQMSAHPVTIWS